MYVKRHESDQIWIHNSVFKRYGKKLRKYLTITQDFSHGENGLIEVWKRQRNVVLVQGRVRVRYFLFRYFLSPKLKFRYGCQEPSRHRIVVDVPARQPMQLDYSIPDSVPGIDSEPLQRDKFQTLQILYCIPVQYMPGKQKKKGEVF